MMYDYATYRQGLLGAGLVIVLGLAAWDGVAAGENCYPNWSEAAPVVVKESLVSARDIHRLVEKEISVKVQRITLCKSVHGYKYKLVVFDAGGKVRKLMLDARMPVVR